MSHLVGAILLRRGRILLGRRSRSKIVAPGAWDLFGGHVEPGETPPAALRRELQEELGIDAPRAVPVMACPLPGGGSYRIFRVERWRGGLPRLRGDEHVGFGWFTLDAAVQLPRLASPRYRPLFASLAAGRRLSSPAGPAVAALSR